MHGVFVDVGSDDEGVIMRVVLKFEVSFGECDWDVGPGGAEVFTFTDVRDGAEVFVAEPSELSRLK